MCIKKSLNAATLQAVHILDSLTQMWMQEPGKEAQEALLGLSHFPAVVQSLVQVLSPGSADQGLLRISFLNQSFRRPF